MAAPVITRTPIVDDDGSGTTGTVINNAWKQELYAQIDALSASLTAAAGMGAWIPVPYNAALFTASPPLTWTVEAADVLYFKYLKYGSLAIFAFDVYQTTLGGSPATQLRVIFPPGILPTQNQVQTGVWVTTPAGGVTSVLGVANINASAGFVELYCDSSMQKPWTPGANSTRVAATLMFEVAP